jgi:hypothetical protein
MDAYRRHDGWQNNFRQKKTGDTYSNDSIRFATRRFFIYSGEVLEDVAPDDDGVLIVGAPWFSPLLVRTFTSTRRFSARP